VNRLALTTKAPNGTGRLPGLAVGKDGAAIEMNHSWTAPTAQATF
jgi:hypothetical protein